SGGECFVDHEDVVAFDGGDGEAEALGHAGGVGAHGQVDEVAEAGEFDDVVVVFAGLGGGHAHGEAAEDDVAFAGEVAHEGGVDAEEGGLAVGVDGAAGGG